MNENSNITGNGRSLSRIIVIALDIFFLVTGILLTVFPDNAMNNIVIVLGIAFIAYCGISIAVYVSKKGEAGITAVNYVISAAAAVVGIILLIFSPQAAVFLPVVTGIWYMICAMYYAGTYFHVTGSAAKFVKTLSLLSAADGIILIITGASGSGYKYGVFTGILFIIFTVLNVITIIMDYQIKKNSGAELNKDYIRGE